jgi:hypothetical protein
MTNISITRELYLFWILFLVSFTVLQATPTKEFVYWSNILPARKVAFFWTRIINDTSYFYIYGGSIGTNKVSDFYEFEFTSNTTTGIWKTLAYHGDKTSPIKPYYGKLRESGKPGVRVYPAGLWTDEGGDLWFLGGETSGKQRLCDVWKYDIKMKLWFWMDGGKDDNCSKVPIGQRPQSSPVYLESTKCVYIFAGMLGPRRTAIATKQIWRYCFNPFLNSTINPFTSLGDIPYTIASAGFAPCVATFNGKIWLYGGGTPVSEIFLEGTVQQNRINWTVIQADKSSVAVIRGRMGNDTDYHRPGSRLRSNCWANAEGFHLYGGEGIDGSGKSVTMNDLWFYSFQTKRWTWIGGNLKPRRTRRFVPVGDVPEPRIDHVFFVDRENNPWIGTGAAAAGAGETLSDFFRIVPSEICYGFRVGDPEVCTSGNGICKSWNNCSCSSNAWGQQCEEFNCWEHYKSDPNVCFGRGACLKPNNCTCSHRFYAGLTCQVNLLIPITMFVSVFVLFLFFTFHINYKTCQLMKNLRCCPKWKWSIQFLRDSRKKTSKKGEEQPLLTRSFLFTDTDQNSIN